MNEFIRIIKEDLYQLVHVPREIRAAVVIVTLLTLVPLSLFAMYRYSKKEQPRIHIFHDMDNQAYYRAQQKNTLFADDRAMRPFVEGTIARGQLRADSHYYKGLREDGEVAETFPEQVRPLTEDFLERGRERYEIYCAACHGYSGYGDGMINKRATLRQEPNWVPPSNFHDPAVRERAIPGHLFSVITDGIRNMPPYGQQIPVRDRWAIAAYVKALEKSQNAELEDVPPAQRSQIQN